MKAYYVLMVQWKLCKSAKPEVAKLMPIDTTQ